MISFQDPGSSVLQALNHCSAKKSAWFSGRYTHWSGSIVATFPITIFSYQGATFYEPILDADPTSRSNSLSPGSCPSLGSIVLEPTGNVIFGTCDKIHEHDGFNNLMETTLILQGMESLSNPPRQKTVPRVDHNGDPLSHQDALL
ncbi:hypothetical protein Egran_04391 [Elaphomyces granulatus]|uniref:Uncharacterized protein n=1 Tax=Elaphomyces granulatus TaxID=519963 RepID=A0A232LUL0_9EURO|nr:hypothetical protein Egran_04391 [Elaphomyces granulatus]